MPGMAQRFDGTENVTRFPNGEERVVSFPGSAVALTTFEPGWRWTNDVRPIVGADRCPKHHVGYMLSGRLHVSYDDGSTLDLAAGDVVEIPPGHDAWVVGSETVNFVDWGARLLAPTKPE
jgi:hypothetical protein